MFFISRWRFFSFNCAPGSPPHVSAPSRVSLPAPARRTHMSGTRSSYLLRVKVCVRKGQERVFLGRLVRSGLWVVLAVPARFLVGSSTARQLLAHLRQRLVAGFRLQNTQPSAPRRFTLGRLSISKFVKDTVKRQLVLGGLIYMA
jgi:hypothetical protein